jgi:hypothetical protein
MKSLFLAGLVVLMGSVSATSVLAAPVTEKTITCVTDANGTYWAPKQLVVTMVPSVYRYALVSIVIDGRDYTKTAALYVNYQGDIGLKVDNFPDYGSLLVEITDSGNYTSFFGGQKSSMTCN